MYNLIEQYIQGIDPQDGSNLNWTITQINLVLEVLQMLVWLFKFLNLIAIIK